MILQPRPVGAARPPAVRATDRRITAAGILLAVAYLVAALGATLLPVETRHGVWLPLHLALAGGAGTAIAAVLPFFSVALAAAPPAAAGLRVTAVAALAGGALGVTLGYAAAIPPVATAGGVAYIAGAALVAWAAFAPLRAALGPSRGIVTRAYAVALADVAAGALLATFFVARVGPFVDHWGAIKPAHAWLNLFGFVSLVIAGTILHLLPTVAGTRIRARRSARIAAALLAAGPPGVALGYLAANDLLARAGALAEIGGAVAIVAYVGAVLRARGRWTTDAAWHRFTTGALATATGWFAFAAIAAAGRVVAFGADPAGWSVVIVGGPLVAGWVGLAVAGAASHLLPAVGPGDQPRHAAQRRVLARGAHLRLGAANAGVALLGIGLPIGSDAATTAGLALVALGLGGTAALLARAMLVRAVGEPV